MVTELSRISEYVSGVLVEYFSDFYGIEDISIETDPDALIVTATIQDHVFKVASEDTFLITVKDIVGDTFEVALYDVSAQNYSDFSLTMLASGIEYLIEEKGLWLYLEAES